MRKTQMQESKSNRRSGFQASACISSTKALLAKAHIMSRCDVSRIYLSSHRSNCRATGRGHHTEREKNVAHRPDRHRHSLQTSSFLITLFLYCLQPRSFPGDWGTQAQESSTNGCSHLQGLPHGAHTLAQLSESPGKGADKPVLACTSRLHRQRPPPNGSLK